MDRRVASLAATAALLALAQPAHADPDEYVITPRIEEGEREIDFKIGTSDLRDGGRESAASLGFGYGITSRWFTEFYARYEKPSSEGTKFDAFEWENRFWLIEHGEVPFDLGLVVEVEWPSDRSEGYEVRLGPLFETGIDRWQLNFNVLFERHLQSDDPGATELGYQWQVRYLSDAPIDFGVQGFGDVGRWNHWDAASAQNHRLGPALFGKVHLGGRQFLVYNAAVLLGVTNASPSSTVRAQVEYEF